MWFYCVCQFLPRDAMQARPLPSCGVCLSVRVCVCLSRSWIVSKPINISSKFFHRRVAKPFYFFPYQTAWQYSDGKPPNGGIECRWGRQQSRFWAYIWLHRELWTVTAASAIHLAATDHWKFITLVAGKPRSLLMARNNYEVYNKKPQRYAEDNVTQW